MTSEPIGRRTHFDLVKTICTRNLFRYLHCNDKNAHSNKCRELRLKEAGHD